MSRLHRNRANVIQTLKTAAALRRCGWPVELIVPPWKAPRQTALRVRELTADAPIEIRATALLHSSVRRFGLMRLCRQIARKAQREQVVVFTRSAELSQALCRAQIAHAFEVHEARTLLASAEGPELLAAHRRGLITHLFPISAAARERLIEAGGADERISVCPSGVDVAAFAAIPPIVDPLLPSDCTALYLGRISDSRGLGVLRAIAQRGCARVVLVGEASEPISAHDSLVYHPFVEHHQVRRWYGATHIVLLPYQAGLRHVDSISPMKLFEALAAGRVVIASDIAPVREIVTDGHDALLVDAENSAAWCAAIRRLREEPDLARRLSANARQTACAYDWQARAEILIDGLL